MHLPNSKLHNVFFNLWCILCYNYSLALSIWDSSCALEEVKLDSIDVWVRVFELPRNMFNLENGEKISKIMGNVLNVDVKDSQYSYLRIRVR